MARCCGSPGCRVPASRRSQWRSSAACSIVSWQVYTLDGDNVRRGLSARPGLFAARPRGEHPSRRRSGCPLRRSLALSASSRSSHPTGLTGRGAARRPAGAVFRGVREVGALDLRAPRPQASLSSRARRRIKDFTGVDAPYEAPEQPGIVIDTETQDIDACVERFWRSSWRAAARKVRGATCRLRKPPRGAGLGHSSQRVELVVGPHG